ncbi:MAG TPA: metallophosphoesterase [Woeseiaceae bacterium]|nr:metallophosphoesterase [Woeseiaceae bacterium]
MMEPPEDSIRVLHVTDPHLFAEAGVSLRGTVTSESFQAVLRHFEDSGWRADLVAMTGDVIQDDSRGAYERFRDLVAPLGLPVHCVPGNHDRPALMREVLDREPFRVCAAEIYGRWLVAGVDSVVEGSPAGRVAGPELARIRAILDGTSAEHALLLVHHPPVPVGSRWLDQVGLENGPEFLETIAGSGKVRAVLFGHVHQAFDGAVDSIRIIGTPSTCAQFETGSDDYAVSGRPPAYRRLALLPDGSLDSELVWLDDKHSR